MTSPMNATIAPDILFTEAEVAAAAGVDMLELRNIQPDGFGVPGHWRHRAGGSGMLYTAKGVEELAKVFDRYANAVAAHSLRTLVQQRTETPSRDGLAKRAPWYRAGQME